MRFPVWLHSTVHAVVKSIFDKLENKEMDLVLFIDLSEG